MLENYSINTIVELSTADSESIVPFVNQKLIKGCSTSMSGNTVQLNKCGVYKIDCDLCFAVDATADLTFKVYVDGIAQPQTVRTVSLAAADSYETTHISTYVTKQDNNCKCNPCTSPTNVYVTVSASVADTVVTFAITDIQAYKAI